MRIDVITTGRTRVPWRWVVFMALLGLPPIIANYCAGSLIFTLRRHVDSPAVLNGISSLDVLFNILIATTCLYFSDRIWTRLGRRTPFVLASWITMAVCLALIPIAGSLWVLIPLVVLWYAFVDVGATLQSLQMEVVPPSQRGRFSAMVQMGFQVLLLLFAIVITARFDDVSSVGAFQLRGEAWIYWLGCLALLGGIGFLVLFVREEKPAPFTAASAIADAPGSSDSSSPASGGLVQAFRTLASDRAMWPVYLLAFSQTLLGTGLGSIDPLLLTEQWGYSKQDLGTNIFIGGMINLALIPLIGWLTDRFDRVRIFAVGVVGIFGCQLAYYLFVTFGLPDQRPGLHHIILFGQSLSICGLLVNTASLPLIYDYIARDRMGTANAGLTIVRSLTRLVTLNGIGLWVTWYSQATAPGAPINYFSGYLFMIGMNFIGLILFFWFVRQLRSGAIRPIGRELPASASSA